MNHSTMSRFIFQIERIQEQCFVNLQGYNHPGQWKTAGTSYSIVDDYSSTSSSSLLSDGKLIGVTDLLPGF